MQIKNTNLVNALLVLVTLFGGSDTFAKTELGALSFFNNHDPSTSFTETYRGITRAGDDLESEWSSAILNASKSVDVAVYELRLPKVAHALAQQFKAGMQVRVVVDNTNRRAWSSLTPKEVAGLSEHDLLRYQDAIALMDLNHDGLVSPTEALERDALKILEAAKVPLIDDTSDGSRGSGLMHHKFMVIDGLEIWTGSANFTMSCTQGDFRNPESRGNWNSAIRVMSAELAQVFLEEFSELWAHRFGLKKHTRAPKTIRVADDLQITVQFSPVSEKKQGWDATANGLIERTLREAKTSVDLALFVFSEQRLVDALIPLNKKGGVIRALVDPSFAYRSYSELLDLMGLELLDARCSYEPDNHPWAEPIAWAGMPVLPQGDLLHHKLAVIDAKQTILGSHNWSLAANQTNDEALLIIDHPSAAQIFIQEIQQLSVQSFFGPSKNLLSKISEQEKRCSPVGTPIM